VATYKIGVCFQELGMIEEAKAFYDEVIAKYPKSNEAAKATSRLKAMSKKKK
jgi:TolA-binding protein